MPYIYHVYILASKRNGTLYSGVTNCLARRIWEHKEGMMQGFTKKYDIKLLVYYEEFNNISEAITREKLLKRWCRAWKLRLIEEMNPNWNDLYSEFVK